MKAAILKRYGTVNDVSVVEVPVPEPKPDEILIKVHAASVNSWDVDKIFGKTIFVRMLDGFFKPGNGRLGCDVAGSVDAVGSKVIQFKRGDEVYSDSSACSWGSLGEYICVKEKYVALKPSNISHGEAASAPHTAVLALQSLRDPGKLQKGESVLFNGAGGGVGTFGVQLAKMLGAGKITCVDRGDKLDMLLKLGADYVIDYTKEDYRNRLGEYDLIVDVTARGDLKSYVHPLKSNGRAVIVGGLTPFILKVMITGGKRKMGKGKVISLLFHKPNCNDLTYLGDLIESGHLKPVIHKAYPFEEVREAIQCVTDGNALGKVVVTI